MLKSTNGTILSIAAIALMVGVARPAAAAGQDDAVKKGEQVYAAQKCSTCHSIAGKGSKRVPLDGVGKKISADETREWIVHPKEMSTKTNSTKKPPMPDKYSKLPAAEIDALVAYMQSLK
jgi:mono/diheme cytochrome c family protein